MFCPTARVTNNTGPPAPVVAYVRRELLPAPFLPGHAAAAARATAAPRRTHRVGRAYPRQAKPDFIYNGARRRSGSHCEIVCVGPPWLVSNGSRRLSGAMFTIEAGISDHVWSLDEMIALLEPSDS